MGVVSMTFSDRRRSDAARRQGAPTEVSRSSPAATNAWNSDGIISSQRLSPTTNNPDFPRRRESGREMSSGGLAPLPYHCRRTLRAGIRLFVLQS